MNVTVFYSFVVLLYVWLALDNWKQALGLKTVGFVQFQVPDNQTNFSLVAETTKKVSLSWNTTGYWFRNTVEVCGVDHSNRSIWNECPAGQLPPFNESYLAYVGKSCGWTREAKQQPVNNSALLQDGLSFWEGIDFNRTRTLQGDVTMLQNAVKRAQNGQCMKIAVVGGSHCAGSCILNPEKYCFGTILAQYLNQRFPVDGCEHVSTANQLCTNGMSSQVHAYRTRKEISSAGPVDIVLFEFGNNDRWYSPSDGSDAFRPGWSLEYIYRKWRASGAAVMFVQSSFRVEWRPKSSVFVALNSQKEHEAFQKEYQVPTISFSPAVLPEFWEQRFNPSAKLYERNFFADYRVHMTPKGHAIIAAMILKRFEEILVETPLHFPIPKPFGFIPANFYKRLDQEELFQVNFDERFDIDLAKANQGLVNVTGDWILTDEGRRKWGLVSTTPGASISVQIPLTARTLFLTLLKSFENVGIVHVIFEDCRRNHDLPPPEIVDCLWETQSSQNSVFVMDFKSNLCTRVNITVAASKRKMNKVKLVSISLTK
jgi:hypothetical protein